MTKEPNRQRWSDLVQAIRSWRASVGGLAEMTGAQTPEFAATRDPVTDLPSRLEAEAHLEIEFAAARRGRLLAAAIFELEGMNAYRQANGNAAGDGALRSMASLLRQHTRRMDLSSRYGPDSFIAVLSGCGEAGALTFAARIQERLHAAQNIVALPNVSIGIACHSADMHTKEQLVGAAEEALTLAKEEGGDRVRIFGHAVAVGASDTADTRPPEAAENGAWVGAIETDAADLEDAPIGRGRKAFLLGTDSVEHARLSRLLQDEGFAIADTHALPRIAAGQADLDIAVLDFAAGAEKVAELTRELRQRSPATRIIGIVHADAGKVPTEAIDVRLDAYHVAGSADATLRRHLIELLAERDVRLHTQLRERQLSAEMRAINREAKLAVAASEARFRAVVQTIQEVIFATDLQGQWVYLNPAWTMITGFTVEDSIGRRMFEFLHPDDQEEVRASFEKLVRSGAPYYRHEGRWRTRGGAYRWVELRLQTTVSGGAVDGASGVMVDVTNRKLAEDALRQSADYFRLLIENSADVLCALNADGTVRYISPAVEDLLGYPAEDWIGRNGFARVHPDDLDAASEELQRLVHDEKRAQDVELRMRHRDGHWVMLELSGRNLLHVSVIGAIVLSARDATERRRTEAAIRQSELRVLHTEKQDAIAHMAGDVASELERHVAAVTEQADVLRAHLPPDPLVDSGLGRLELSAARVHRLVRELRAIGRQQPLEPSALDLNLVVHELLAALRERCGDRIELATELTAGPRSVHADASAMRELILALVEHACDAIPELGRITIATSRCEVRPQDPLAREMEPGGYGVVTISDTRPAMDEPAVEHAFEPVLGPTSPQRREFGLAAVHGIVKQSGGHVQIESDPDATTRVTLYLPASAGP